jgi:hypothetical protein
MKSDGSSCSQKTATVTYWDGSIQSVNTHLRWFINVFTKDRHYTLFWVRSIHSVTTHPRWFINVLTKDLQFTLFWDGTTQSVTIHPRWFIKVLTKDRHLPFPETALFIPYLHTPRWFNNLLTKDRHFTLFWDGSIQSITTHTPMVHQHAHKRPPLYPTLKRLYSVHKYHRWFITVLTKDSYFTILWDGSIQSVITHPISPRFIKILISRLCLHTPSGLFLLRFRDRNFLCISTVPQVYCTPLPTHSSWYNHRKNIRWRLQVMKLLIALLMHIPFHSIPLQVIIVFLTVY